MKQPSPTKLSALLAAFLAASLAAAPALAQDQRDPVLPVEPSFPTPSPGAPTRCIGWSAEVTVNPGQRETRTNFHSINAALCAVTSSEAVPGKITVSSKPGGYREEFTIAKAGLTMAAAPGDTVMLVPGRSRCATISASGRTKISGFSFHPGAGRTACIYVRAGTLDLSASRIQLSTEGSTAIHVGPGAALNFIGSTYDRHGVFHSGGPMLAERVTGVRADISGSVNLASIRLENLTTAVESRARANAFTRVEFNGNLTAVELTEVSGNEIEAPNLTIAGGKFIGSGTAIRLVAGAPAADRPNPYRGAVCITGAGAGATPCAIDQNASSIPAPPICTAKEPTPLPAGVEPVVFARNAKAFETNAASFEKTLVVADAVFERNFIHALQFRLPENRMATIARSSFRENGHALAIVGPLGGKLCIGAAINAAGREGLRIEGGKGSLDAKLSSASGPAMSFGAAFFDETFYSISIADSGDPSLLLLSQESSLCEAGVNAKWKVFRALLSDLNIRVGGKEFQTVYSKRGRRPSGSELREAYRLICRPPAEES